ncbi:MAG: diguanylate cyclase [Gammaproteobacteria bacterium]
MKQGTLRCLALWLLLACAPVPAAAPDPGAADSILIIAGETQRTRLEGRFDIVPALAAGHPAWSAATDAYWLRAGENKRLPGMSTHGWWLQLHLRNADDVDRERVLYIQQPTLDDVRFEYSCSNGYTTSATSGDAHPYSSRDIPDRQPAFAFLVPAAETCRMVIAVSTLETLQFPAVLTDTATYLMIQQRDNLLHGLMLGMNFLLVAGAIALAIISRRYTAVLFVAMVGSHVALTLVMSGIGYQFYWGEMPVLQRALPSVSIATAWMLTGSLSKHILPRNNGATKASRLLKHSYWLAALIATAHLLFPDARLMGGLIVIVVLGLSALAAETVGAVVHRGETGHRFPVNRTAAATAVLVVSAVIESLGFIGVIPLGEHYLLALQAGFLIQGALLLDTLATALPKEKAAIPAAEHEINRRVAERTRELASMVAQLKSSNSELDRMSRTDPLTGTFNRRFMDNSLVQLAQVATRDRMPVSFLLIDIDYFKQVNDRYGHPIGDSCLRQVASTIRSQLRDPPDLLCRYGGEEFAVILPGTDQEGAMVVAEKIRQAVSSAPITDNDGNPVPITISTGISTVMGCADIQALIYSADQALYEAKRSGRNRCQVAPA